MKPLNSDKISGPSGKAADEGDDAGGGKNGRRAVTEGSNNKKRSAGSSGYGSLELMADGSMIMTSSLVAGDGGGEVAVLSRAMFIRALNASRLILRRRQRDKQKKATERASMRASAAVAAAGGGATRMSMFGGTGAPGKKKSKGKKKGNDKQLKATMPTAQEGGQVATVGDGDDDGGDGNADDVDDFDLLGTLTDAWPYMSRPEIRLRNLREVKVLGRGAFGLVRCVRDKLSAQTGTAIGSGKDRNEYALKALAKPALKKANGGGGGGGGRGLDKIIRERDAQVGYKEKSYKVVTSAR